MSSRRSWEHGEKDLDWMAFLGQDFSCRKNLSIHTLKGWQYDSKDLIPSLDLRMGVNLTKVRLTSSPNQFVPSYESPKNVTANHQSKEDQRRSSVVTSDALIRWFEWLVKWMDQWEGQKEVRSPALLAPPTHNGSRGGSRTDRCRVRWCGHRLCLTLSIN